MRDIDVAMSAGRTAGVSPLGLNLRGADARDQTGRAERVHAARWRFGADGWHPHVISRFVAKEWFIQSAVEQRAFLQLLGPALSPSTRSEFVASASSPQRGNKE